MKAQAAIRHDKEDLLRAAHAMIMNHGNSAAAIAAERARNLAMADAKDARQIWEHVVLTINQIQAVANRPN